MFVIPLKFKSFMQDIHGEDGAAWLERLPAILAACAERWDLEIEAPFANLSFHYVTRARRRSDNMPVVLKACSPTNEFVLESSAIAHFEGHGMVRLLDTFPEHEVMLLEYITPGELLIQMEDDEEATRQAAGVMRRLWRPVPERHKFPSVIDWGKGFQRLHAHYSDGYGPFPRRMLDEAERTFMDLLASMDTPVLLHGDLHHENILQSERELWLAIDPKGVIGEPAYEVGALLRNPLPGLLRRSDPRRVQERRVAILSEELGIDRERVRGWGFSQAVLSVWWSVEDSGDYSQDTMACAELLAE
ncbi:aminoglycoside phosphotransferase family protein [Ktedonospora formicarum]|uniref:Hydroxyurea phosphotransferase n=1 Tax=Ktedonospora formicarum TaxID=2778364 RepID=A0A8J3MX44_9CHLR|nr:aminoglycoside phosphotransferase family protein [Ktedonospora formicarum]GHO49348.1 hydroxyurea phosphotransferase [Ktedonospora formicarum]